MSRQRFLGVVGATVAGTTMLATPPAMAGTITQDFVCSANGHQILKTFNVTITAPATITRNQPTPVTIKIVDPVNATQPIAAGVIRANVTLQLGGAAGGTVQTGELTNPAIAAGTPWRVEGSPNVTIPTAGTVTLGLRGWRTLTTGFACGKAGDTTPIAETVTVVP